MAGPLDPRPMIVTHRAPADEGVGGGDVVSPVGSGEISIARDGTWYHEGRAIRRRGLVKLFATALRREGDGVYRLRTPVEAVRVHVEDAPFVAEEMARAGAGRSQVLRFRTNVDQWVEAGPDHPLRVESSPETDEPRPYILIRDGLEALLVRSVFYALVELAEPAGRGGEEVLGVWSHGMFFPLGPAA